MTDRVTLPLHSYLARESISFRKKLARYRANPEFASYLLADLAESYANLLEVMSQQEKMKAENYAKKKP